MADRSTTAPADLFRWVMALAALGPVLSALTSLFHRRRREPTLPRMSEEWLKTLDHDSGRQIENWRDSW